MRRSGNWKIWRWKIGFNNCWQGTNVTALSNQTENEARIRELTQERDNLLAKLGAANQQLYGTKKPDAGGAGGTVVGSGSDLA